MKTKRGIPDATKKAEGKALRAKWEAYRRDNPGVTQEAFCSQLGLNQGYFQQMFSGTSAIPLEALLDMAILMDFDPREVRPEVDRIMRKLLRAIEGASSEQIERRVQALPRESQAAALEYLDFLASRSGRSE